MTSKRTKVVTVDLTDKAGELARVLTACREAKADLTGTWGWSMGNGKAQAMLMGKDSKKIEEALKATGMKTTTGDACVCEGEDRLGVMQECLDKLAKAGVNLHAVDAMAVGGKFRSVIWADTAQYEKVCKTLGC